MSRPRGSIPWYKEKFPIARYLTRGEPRILTDEIIAVEAPVFPITEEENTLWEDHRETIKNKNKKREFNITIPEPVELDIGNYRMTIEVLHTDYQGFKYSAEGRDIIELETTFWPTVTKLLAHYCSPRIRPIPPVFNPHPQ